MEVNKSQSMSETSVKQCVEQQTSKDSLAGPKREAHTYSEQTKLKDQMRTSITGHKTSCVPSAAESSLKIVQQTPISVNPFSMSSGQDLTMQNSSPLHTLHHCTQSFRPVSTTPLPSPSQGLCLPQQNTFSLRIVTLDYYCTAPIEGLDPFCSTFRGAPVNRVPVIRVFGATPTGQNSCLHVHGVFPYILLPFRESLPLHRLALALDRAINVALGRTAATTHHVYNIQHVSGRPLYGYYSNEHQFVKVYFYNPLIVKKAVDLLQSGCVLGEVFQSYESHVPYQLQFLLDHNLHGMNLLHAANLCFRRGSAVGADGVVDTQKENFPCQGQHVPTISTPSQLSFMGDAAGAVGAVGLTASQQVSCVQWSADTISRLARYLPDTVPRLASCELELDVQAGDILNTLQLAGGMSSNPGLAYIWEDELERRQQRKLQQASDADKEDGSSLSIADLLPPSSPPRPDVLPTSSELHFRALLKTRLNEQSETSLLNADTTLPLITPDPSLLNPATLPQLPAVILNPSSATEASGYLSSALVMSQHQEEVAQNYDNLVDEEIAATFSQANASQYFSSPDLSLVGHLAQLASDTFSASVHNPVVCEPELKDSEDSDDEELSRIMSQPALIPMEEDDHRQMDDHSDDSSNHLRCSPQASDGCGVTNVSLHGLTQATSEASNFNPLLSNLPDIQGKITQIDGSNEIRLPGIRSKKGIGLPSPLFVDTQVTNTQDHNLVSSACKANEDLVKPVSTNVSSRVFNPVVGLITLKYSSNFSESYPRDALLVKSQVPREKSPIKSMSSHRDKIGTIRSNNSTRLPLKVRSTQHKYLTTVYKKSRNAFAVWMSGHTNDCCQSSSRSLFCLCDYCSIDSELDVVQLDGHNDRHRAASQQQYPPNHGAPGQRQPPLPSFSGHQPPPPPPHQRQQGPSDGVPSLHNQARTSFSSHGREAVPPPQQQRRQGRFDGHSPKQDYTRGRPNPHQGDRRRGSSHHSSYYPPAQSVPPGFGEPGSSSFQQLGSSVAGGWGVRDPAPVQFSSHPTPPQHLISGSTSSSGGRQQSPSPARPSSSASYHNVPYPDLAGASRKVHNSRHPERYQQHSTQQRNPRAAATQPEASQKYQPQCNQRQGSQNQQQSRQSTYSSDRARGNVRNVREHDNYSSSHRPGSVSVVPVTSAAVSRNIPGIGNAVVIPALMSNRPIAIGGARHQTSYLSNDSSLDQVSADDLLQKAMSIADIDVGDNVVVESTSPSANVTAHPKSQNATLSQGFLTGTTSAPIFIDENYSDGFAVAAYSTVESTDEGKTHASHRTDDSSAAAFGYDGHRNSKVDSSSSSRTRVMHHSKNSQTFVPLNQSPSLSKVLSEEVISNSVSKKKPACKQNDSSAQNSSNSSPEIGSNRFAKFPEDCVDGKKPTKMAAEEPFINFSKDSKSKNKKSRSTKSKKTQSSHSQPKIKSDVSGLGHAKTRESSADHSKKCSLTSKDKMAQLFGDESPPPHPRSPTAFRCASSPLSKTVADPVPSTKSLGRPPTPDSMSCPQNYGAKRPSTPGNIFDCYMPSGALNRELLPLSDDGFGQTSLGGLGGGDWDMLNSRPRTPGTSPQEEDMFRPCELVAAFGFTADAADILSRPPTPTFGIECLSGIKQTDIDQHWSSFLSAPQTPSFGENRVSPPPAISNLLPSSFDSAKEIKTQASSLKPEKALDERQGDRHMKKEGQRKSHAHSEDATVRDEEKIDSGTASNKLEREPRSKSRNKRHSKKDSSLVEAKAQKSLDCIDTSHGSNVRKDRNNTKKASMKAASPPNHGSPVTNEDNNELNQGKSSKNSSKAKRLPPKCEELSSGTKRLIPDNISNSIPERVENVNSKNSTFLSVDVSNSDKSYNRDDQKKRNAFSRSSNKSSKGRDEGSHLSNKGTSEDIQTKWKPLKKIDFQRSDMVLDCVDSSSLADSSKISRNTSNKMTPNLIDAPCRQNSKDEMKNSSKLANRDPTPNLRDLLKTPQPIMSPLPPTPAAHRDCILSPTFTSSTHSSSQFNTFAVSRDSSRHSSQNVCTTNMRNPSRSTSRNVTIPVSRDSSDCSGKNSSKLEARCSTVPGPMDSLHSVVKNDGKNLSSRARNVSGSGDTNPFSLRSGDPLSSRPRDPARPYPMDSFNSDSKNYSGVSGSPRPFDYVGVEARTSTTDDCHLWTGDSSMFERPDELMSPIPPTPLHQMEDIHFAPSSFEKMRNKSKKFVKRLHKSPEISNSAKFNLMMNRKPLSPLMSPIPPTPTHAPSGRHSFDVTPSKVSSAYSPVPPPSSPMYSKDNPVMPIEPSLDAQSLVQMFPMPASPMSPVPRTPRYDQTCYHNSPKFVARPRFDSSPSPPRTSVAPLSSIHRTAAELVQSINIPNSIMSPIPPTPVYSQSTSSSSMHKNKIQFYSFDMGTMKTGRKSLSNTIPAIVPDELQQLMSPIPATPAHFSTGNDSTHETFSMFQTPRSLISPIKATPAHNFSSPPPSSCSSSHPSAITPNMAVAQNVPKFCVTKKLPEQELKRSMFSPVSGSPFSNCGEFGQWVPDDNLKSNTTEGSPSVSVITSADVIVANSLPVVADSSRTPGEFSVVISSGRVYSEDEPPSLTQINEILDSSFMQDPDPSKDASAESDFKKSPKNSSSSVLSEALASAGVHDSSLNDLSDQLEVDISIAGPTSCISQTASFVNADFSSRQQSCIPLNSSSSQHDLPASSNTSHHASSVGSPHSIFSPKFDSSTFDGTTSVPIATSTTSFSSENLCSFTQASPCNSMPGQQINTSDSSASQSNVAGVDLVPFVIPANNCTQTAPLVNLIGSSVPNLISGQSGTGIISSSNSPQSDVFSPHLTSTASLANSTTLLPIHVQLPDPFIDELPKTTLPYSISIQPQIPATSLTQPLPGQPHCNQNSPRVGPSCLSLQSSPVATLTNFDADIPRPASACLPVSLPIASNTQASNSSSLRTQLYTSPTSQGMTCVSSASQVMLHLSGTGRFHAPVSAEHKTLDASLQNVENGSHITQRLLQSSPTNHVFQQTSPSTQSFMQTSSVTESMLNTTSVIHSMQQSAATQGLLHNSPSTRGVLHTALSTHGIQHTARVTGSLHHNSPLSQNMQLTSPPVMQGVVNSTHRMLGATSAPQGMINAVPMTQTLPSYSVQLPPPQSFSTNAFQIAEPAFSMHTAFPHSGRPKLLQQEAASLNVHQPYINNSPMNSSCQTDHGDISNQAASCGAFNTASSSIPQTLSDFNFDTLSVITDHPPISEQIEGRITSLTTSPHENSHPNGLQSSPAMNGTKTTSFLQAALLAPPRSDFSITPSAVASHCSPISAPTGENMDSMGSCERPMILAEALNSNSMSCDDFLSNGNMQMANDNPKTTSLSSHVQQGIQISYGCTTNQFPINQLSENVCQNQVTPSTICHNEPFQGYASLLNDFGDGKNVISSPLMQCQASTQIQLSSGNMDSTLCPDKLFSLFGELQTGSNAGDSDQLLTIPSLHNAASGYFSDEEKKRQEAHEKLQREKKYLEDKRKAEKIEEERKQQEKEEKARQQRLEWEHQLQEQERLEKERLEKERIEVECHEKALVEKERFQNEGIEKERVEKERAEKEQIEKERIEKERTERERMERERMERERMERERMERERLERERTEREHAEKERMEKEQMEKERMEKELMEKERILNERLEREHLEQERLEQERLEQVRLEQVRLEQERLEQERLEQERLEQERLEQERLEQERLEQERLEQERLEQERLEQERLEQERLEQERLEQERLEQERLEQDRLERDRLERERLERERLEQERLEQERLEQERLEQERLEQERLEQKRLEQERLEQERLEQERLEQERLEQERLEQERLEQERLEQERQKQERQEQERLEQKRLEQERQEQERLEQEHKEWVRIEFEKRGKLEREEQERKWQEQNEKQKQDEYELQLEIGRKDEECQRHEQGMQQLRADEMDDDERQERLKQGNIKQNEHNRQLMLERQRQQSQQLREEKPQKEYDPERFLLGDNEWIRKSQELESNSRRDEIQQHQNMDRGLPQQPTLVQLPSGFSQVQECIALHNQYLLTDQRQQIELRGHGKNFDRSDKLYPTQYESTGHHQLAGQHRYNHPQQITPHGGIDNMSVDDSRSLMPLVDLQHSIRPTSAHYSQALIRGPGAFSEPADTHHRIDNTLLESASFIGDKTPGSKQFSQLLGQPQLSQRPSEQHRAIFQQQNNVIRATESGTFAEFVPERLHPPHHGTHASQILQQPGHRLRFGQPSPQPAVMAVPFASLQGSGLTPRVPVRPSVNADRRREIVGSRPGSAQPMFYPRDVTIAMQSQYASFNNGANFKSYPPSSGNMPMPYNFNESIRLPPPDVHSNLHQSLIKSVDDLNVCTPNVHHSNTNARNPHHIQRMLNEHPNTNQVNYPVRVSPSTNMQSALNATSVSCGPRSTPTPPECVTASIVTTISPPSAWKEFHLPQQQMPFATSTSTSHTSTPPHHATITSSPSINPPLSWKQSSHFKKNLLTSRHSKLQCPGGPRPESLPSASMAQPSGVQITKLPASTDVHASADVGLSSLLFGTSKQAKANYGHSNAIERTVVTSSPDTQTSPLSLVISKQLASEGLRDLSTHQMVDEAMKQRFFSNQSAPVSCQELLSPLDPYCRTSPSGLSKAPKALYSSSACDVTKFMHSEVTCTTQSLALHTPQLNSGPSIASLRRQSANDASLIMDGIGTEGGSCAAFPVGSRSPSHVTNSDQRSVNMVSSGSNPSRIDRPLRAHSSGNLSVWSSNTRGPAVASFPQNSISISTTRSSSLSPEERIKILSGPKHRDKLPSPDDSPINVVDDAPDPQFPNPDVSIPPLDPSNSLKLRDACAASQYPLNSADFCKPMNTAQTMFIPSVGRPDLVNPRETSLSIHPLDSDSVRAKETSLVMLSSDTSDVVKQGDTSLGILPSDQECMKRQDLISMNSLSLEGLGKKVANKLTLTRQDHPDIGSAFSRLPIAEIFEGSSTAQSLEHSGRLDKFRKHCLQRSYNQPHIVSQSSETILHQEGVREMERISDTESFPAQDIGDLHSTQPIGSSINDASASVQHALINELFQSRKAVDGRETNSQVNTEIGVLNKDVIESDEPTAASILRTLVSANNDISIPLDPNAEMDVNFSPIFSRDIVRHDDSDLESASNMKISRILGRRRHSTSSRSSGSSSSCPSLMASPVPLSPSSIAAEPTITALPSRDTPEPSPRKPVSPGCCVETEIEALVEGRGVRESPGTGVVSVDHRQVCRTSSPDDGGRTSMHREDATQGNEGRCARRAIEGNASPVAQTSEFRGTLATPAGNRNSPAPGDNGSSNHNSPASRSNGSSIHNSPASGANGSSIHKSPAPGVHGSSIHMSPAPGVHGSSTHNSPAPGDNVDTNHNSPAPGDDGNSDHTCPGTGNTTVALTGNKDVARSHLVDSPASTEVELLFDNEEPVSRVEKSLQPTGKPSNLTSIITNGNVTKSSANVTEVVVDSAGSSSVESKGNNVQPAAAGCDETKRPAKPQLHEVRSLSVSSDASSLSGDVSPVTKPALTTKASIKEFPDDFPYKSRTNQDSNVRMGAESPARNLSSGPKKNKSKTKKPSIVSSPVQSAVNTRSRRSTAKVSYSEFFDPEISTPTSKLVICSTTAVPPTDTPAASSSCSAPVAVMQPPRRSDPLVSALPVKRKRGRPRKVVPLPDSPSLLTQVVHHSLAHGKLATNSTSSPCSVPGGNLSETSVAKPASPAVQTPVIVASTSPVMAKPAPPSTVPETRVMEDKDANVFKAPTHMPLKLTIRRVSSGKRLVFNYSKSDSPNKRRKISGDINASSATQGPKGTVTGVQSKDFEDGRVQYSNKEILIPRDPQDPLGFNAPDDAVNFSIGSYDRYDTDHDDVPVATRLKRLRQKRGINVHQKMSRKLVKKSIRTPAHDPTYSYLSSPYITPCSTPLHTSSSYGGGYYNRTPLYTPKHRINFDSGSTPSRITNVLKLHLVNKNGPSFKEREKGKSIPKKPSASSKKSERASKKAKGVISVGGGPVLGTATACGKALQTNKCMASATKRSLPETGSLPVMQTSTKSPLEKISNVAVHATDKCSIVNSNISLNSSSSSQLFCTTVPLHPKPTAISIPPKEKIILKITKLPGEQLVCGSTLSKEAPAAETANEVLAAEKPKIPSLFIKKGKVSFLGVSSSSSAATSNNSMAEVPVSNNATDSVAMCAPAVTPAPSVTTSGHITTTSTVATSTPFPLLPVCVEENTLGSDGIVSEELAAPEEVLDEMHHQRQLPPRKRHMSWKIPPKSQRTSLKNSASSTGLPETPLTSAVSSQMPVSNGIAPSKSGDSMERELAAIVGVPYATPLREVLSCETDASDSPAPFTPSVQHASSLSRSLNEVTTSLPIELIEKRLAAIVGSPCSPYTSRCDSTISLEDILLSKDSPLSAAASVSKALGIEMIHSVSIITSPSEEAVESAANNPALPSARLSSAKPTDENLSESFLTIPASLALSTNEISCKAKSIQTVTVSPIPVSSTASTALLTTTTAGHNFTRAEVSSSESLRSLATASLPSKSSSSFQNKDLTKSLHDVHTRFVKVPDVKLKTVPKVLIQNLTCTEIKSLRSHAYITPDTNNEKLPQSPPKLRNKRKSMPSGNPKSLEEDLQRSSVAKSIFASGEEDKDIRSSYPGKIRKIIAERERQKVLQSENHTESSIPPGASSDETSSPTPTFVFQGIGLSSKGSDGKKTTKNKKSPVRRRRNKVAPNIVPLSRPASSVQNHSPDGETRQIQDAPLPDVESQATPAYPQNNQTHTGDASVDSNIHVPSSRPVRSCKKTPSPQPSPVALNNITPTSATTSVQNRDSSSQNIISLTAQCDGDSVFDFNVPVATNVSTSIEPQMDLASNESPSSVRKVPNVVSPILDISVDAQEGVTRRSSRRLAKRCYKLEDDLETPPTKKRRASKKRVSSLSNPCNSVPTHVLDNLLAQTLDSVSHPSCSSSTQSSSVDDSSSAFEEICTDELSRSSKQSSMSNASNGTNSEYKPLTLKAKSGKKVAASGGVGDTGGDDPGDVAEMWRRDTLKQYGDSVDDTIAPYRDTMYNLSYLTPPLVDGSEHVSPPVPTSPDVSDLEQQKMLNKKSKRQQQILYEVECDQSNPRLTMVIRKIGPKTKLERVSEERQPAIFSEAERVKKFLQNLKQYITGTELEVIT